MTKMSESDDAGGSSLNLRRVSAEALLRDDTASSTVLNAIEDAFGEDGPGIILINDLRDDYQEERRNLLWASREFALLPDNKKKEFELPEVDYSTGWSCGKEMFRGKVDFAKGSFYANPLLDSTHANDRDIKLRYP